MKHLYCSLGPGYIIKKHLYWLSGYLIKHLYPLSKYILKYLHILQLIIVCQIDTCRCKESMNTEAYIPCTIALYRIQALYIWNNHHLWLIVSTTIICG